MIESVYNITVFFSFGVGENTSLLTNNNNEIWWLGPNQICCLPHLFSVFLSSSICYNWLRIIQSEFWLINEKSSSNKQLEPQCNSDLHFYLKVSFFLQKKKQKLLFILNNWNCGKQFILRSKLMNLNIAIFGFENELSSTINVYKLRTQKKRAKDTPNRSR